jgi:hypothetical protein
MKRHVPLTYRKLVPTAEACKPSKSNSQAETEARKKFQEWFVREFYWIGVRGPDYQSADIIFDRVVALLKTAERIYGDASATHGS